MKKNKPEDNLEEYLNDRSIPDDPELASLARTADRLERGLNVEAPDAYRERALFIQGVAARKPGFPWARLMVPVMAASMLVAFVAIGRDAQPGDALYGFRKTLDKVGLAEDTARSARHLLDEAADDVVQGESLLTQERYAAAHRMAVDALLVLREAEALLEDGSGEAREVGYERLEDLVDRARDVQEDAWEEQQELREERREERADRDGDDGGDDNSGRGGGDDSGGDDSSGSGSGDDSGGDDSSGSGSGDDSGGDDSSGSGSGDDSSGSGSGGDDN